MKKIGILLGSINCSKYLYETVSELATSDQIELFFLLNSDAAVERGFLEKIEFLIKTKGLFRFMELVLFDLLVAIEYRILATLSHSQKLREHNVTFSIDEFKRKETVYLRPVFSSSGRIVRYSDEDIDRIKSLNLKINC